MKFNWQEQIENNGKPIKKKFLLLNTAKQPELNECFYISYNTCLMFLKVRKLFRNILEENLISYRQ